MSDSTFIVAISLAAMVPTAWAVSALVAILTKHQQRMAELMHGGQSDARRDEVDQLRREISDLRQRVDQQTLALDGAASAMLQPPSTPTTAGDLSRRLGESQTH
ncbi:MAG: hypothetical protein HYR64_05285 [Fimbriimonas ginsengisoli]|uniref:Uncharacterized protein n=1 Tax=Fimbriimonas ginsengisoli TaxID=1005039 RepID=A0A931LVK7_FIMGI|nr:hypothetical protein [Fimbriimonas ginsengisoli]